MSKVELVGIVNVTPDSFSDGGDYFTASKAIKRTDELFTAGASIVDIGAESTRPGAVKITPDEEWRRLQPIWEDVAFRYNGRLSLDTQHPETVLRAATYGDFIVNDVSTLHDQAMIEAVAKLGLRCIVSHIPAAANGSTQTAHTGTLITSIGQVRQELLEKRDELQHAGIAKGRIILDPGIGFGKTRQLNHELLGFAQLVPDSDVMIGYSRKRFLGENRMDLDVNIAAARIAIAAGARYLHVHDVTGHRELLEKELRQ